MSLLTEPGGRLRLATAGYGYRECLSDPRAHYTALSIDLAGIEPEHFCGMRHARRGTEIFDSFP